MKHALLLAGLVATIALASSQTQGTGQAQSQYTPDQDQRMTSNGDADFLSTLARDDMAEVMTGRLAERKATNSRVKSGARMMVKDHGAHLTQVRRLSSRMNVTLPTDVGTEHQQMADQLQGLSGTEFNRAYVSGMLDDHVKTLNFLRDRINAGGDAQVTALARKTFTTVRKHAVMWNSLARTYKIQQQDIPKLSGMPTRSSAGR